MRTTIFLTREAVGNIVYTETAMAIEADKKSLRMKHIRRVRKLLEALGYKLIAVQRVGIGTDLVTQERGVFIEVDLNGEA